MDSRLKESQMIGQMSVQLELQKTELHDGKVIGIIENSNNSYGNFILSVVMDQKLKGNEGVCFLSLLHPQSHYQYVGNKVGHNLKACIEKQQVTFLDAIRLTQESILEDNIIKLGESLILWLSKSIEDCVKDLHLRYERVTIIIDDISVLLSLGCSVKQIQCFLQYLFVFTSNKSEKNAPDRKKISLAVLTHVNSEDEESQRLSATIKHASQFCASVSPLRIIVTNNKKKN